ncbi:MAG: SDR family oxidoreductase [Solirubrobacterales bacterium]|nr:SDR family oxidoreductase [Solirubrobacterales bacterium]
METSLEGAVVAITGGAQGIGRATAEAMVGQGARVAIGDLDLEKATAAAGELGENAVGLHLDVADRDSFRQFLDSAESLLGPLDGLVNNAGVMIVGPAEEEDPAATAAMIAVNLTGVINGTQLAIGLMKPRHRGRIINIASQAGKAGLPGGATYCATKSAVIAYSEAVRGELKGSGVGIAWVLPGIVNTELAAGLPEIGLMDALEPSDIAAAVTKTMAEGGSEVWVPAVNQWLDAPVRLLPRRARERILALTGADKVLAAADPVRRKDYEEQAADRT